MPLLKNTKVIKIPNSNSEDDVEVKEEEVVKLVTESYIEEMLETSSNKYMEQMKKMSEDFEKRMENMTKKQEEKFEKIMKRIETAIDRIVSASPANINEDINAIKISTDDIGKLAIGMKSKVSWPRARSNFGSIKFCLFNISRILVKFKNENFVET